MTTTPRASLPELVPSQFNKELYHNQALSILEALTVGGVQSRTVTSAPSLINGQIYIVPPSATGIWSTHVNSYAIAINLNWIYISPYVGSIVYVIDTDTEAIYNGSTWSTYSSGGGGGGVSSFNTRTGAVTLTSSDVTTALTFTPYNATNPSGYITSSSLSPYLLSSTAAATYYIIPTGTTSQYIRGDGTLATFPTIPTVGTWGALDYPTWVIGTPFVKMTGVGTFALDNNIYLTGNEFITLSGDVTGSGTTGITTTIANNAITFAKFQNIAANSILGNNTGSTATATALTGTQTTALLDTFTYTLKGLVPAPTGFGTARFLREDQTWVLPGREILTANRTYYVRTDGSNSNTGLINSSGGAFLTIQKAVDIINQLDINGFTVTVQVGSGTYAENILLKEVVGYSTPGCLVLLGNETTPSNVLVAPSSGNCFNSSSIAAVWDIRGFKVQSAGVGNGILVNRAAVRYGKMDFGAFTFLAFAAHLSANNGGFITAIGDYWISGRNGAHLIANTGLIEVVGRTITFLANIAFSSFVQSSYNSTIYAYSNTWSLGAFSVTGQRFTVNSNSVIATFGATTVLPGNSVPTAPYPTGGQYI